MKKSHKDKTDIAASELLGKKVDGFEFYNPSILVAVPREDNRRHYDINCADLPFEGWDVWHAYEFSSLTENGIPVTRVVKLRYNCTSEYIVESKSLKLYLNSFNMTRSGRNIEECLTICKARIERDLSNKLQTLVEVNFLSDKSFRFEIFNDFQNIMELVDDNVFNITEFNEAPELLKIEDFKNKQKHYLMFDSLRSNCRVTHQPDFGDVYIYYNSKKHINEVSLIKYLVSFRSEYHFHEECCEMIYKRLFDLLDEGDELMVSALYTRRGGIDISPVRKTNNVSLHDVNTLIDLTSFARCGIKQ